MSPFGFRAYVDESGDEGFVFNSDGSGSSRWMVLSAVVARQSSDLSIVKMLREVRKVLQRDPGAQLHFRNLKHEQRVAYVKHIAETPLWTISVIVDKRSLHEPERFQAEKFLLYRYATRFLLERVSWLCRDRRTEGDGDGRVEIIFSNRSIMSYDALRSYLKLLKEKSDPMDVRIDWSVVDPGCVSARNHDQLAGLQVADAVASSFFYAVQINRYGDVESRYATVLSPTIYRHKGSPHGYGLKFWPQDPKELLKTNPHLATFADGGVF